jgi:hypothetical protein
VYRRGVAPFHKQWGTYPNNPLVLEDGENIADAKAMDKFGKGGGPVDEVLVHGCAMARGSRSRSGKSLN